MKTKLFLLVIGFLFLIPIAKAQEELPSQKSFEIVANVHVYDTKIASQDKNIFKITFDLNNSGENQSGIKYGVILLNKETQVVWDEKVYPETITLNKDETQKKEIIYEAPSFLKGEYFIMVESKSENGFPFGQGIGGAIKLDGTGNYIKLNSDKCFLKVEGESTNKEYHLREGVDITKDEIINLTCSLEDVSSFGDKVNFKALTHNRTPFGELISEDKGSASIKNNQLSIRLPKAPNPQAYDVLITLLDEVDNVLSNKLNVHYVLSGPSATIQNAVLDKDTYQKGESPKLTLLWTGSADSFPNSRLNQQADKDLKLTISSITTKGETKNLESILKASEQGKKNEIIFNPLSESGITQFKISILDNENNLLDEVILPVKTPQEVITEKESIFDNKLPLIMIVFILVILLLLLAKFISSGGIKISIFILFFTFISFYSNNVANGAPINFIRWIDAGHYYAANGSADLNKVVYAPGETIYGTFYLAIAQCNNAGPLSPMRWDTVNSANGAYSANTLTPSGNYGYFSHTASYTPGAHNITFGGCYIVYLGAQEICIGNDSAPIFNFSFNRYISINIPYVVASPVPIPATPSVSAAACNVTGTQATISWSTPANTTYFAIRNDKDSNSWSGTCAAINPGDTCENTGATSGAFATTPGNNNFFWVHACNASGCSAGAASVGFNCPAAITPIVYLDPPVTNLSLNNNSATISSKIVNLSWGVSNAAQACGTGCNCVASGGSWSGTKTYPNSQNVTIPPTAGTLNYTLTCTAPASLGGLSGSDTAVVNASCDNYSWTDTTCSEPCGGGNFPTHNINSSCVQTNNIGAACNTDACPLESRWKEVRP